jgi:hypothetical protein
VLEERIRGNDTGMQVAMAAVAVIKGSRLEIALLR